MSNVKRPADESPRGAPAAAHDEDASENLLFPRARPAGRRLDDPSSPRSTLSPKTLIGLALLATGVVFGDIGTSPLYAFRLNFGPEVGLAPTPHNVLGVASLIFWSLTLVISIKYLLLVLRADHDGEGGILVLLAQSRPWRLEMTRSFLLLLGLFGAALLYADGVITPAISVLSAVEGVATFDPAYKPVAWPVTVAILLIVFLLQHRGTAGVGRVFGPIIAMWFLAIA